MCKREPGKGKRRKRTPRRRRWKAPRGAGLASADGSSRLYRLRLGVLIARLLFATGCLKAFYCVGFLATCERMRSLKSSTDIGSRSAGKEGLARFGAN